MEKKQGFSIYLANAMLYISQKVPQDTLTFITMCLSLSCSSSSNSVEIQPQDNVKPINFQCQPLPAA